MNTVYVDAVYIGKAKNLGQGLLSDTDKYPVVNIDCQALSSRLLGLPLEGLRA